jgi:hypothetical protein
MVDNVLAKMSLKYLAVTRSSTVRSLCWSPEPITPVALPRLLAQHRLLLIALDSSSACLDTLEGERVLLRATNRHDLAFLFFYSTAHIKTVEFLINSIDPTSNIVFVN